MSTRNVPLTQNTWTLIAPGKCLATLESGDECFVTLAASKPTGFDVPKHRLNEVRGYGFYNDGSFSGNVYAYPASVGCVIAVSE